MSSQSAPSSSSARPAPSEHDVRVGLLGYGYWGPQLARNLDRVPGCAVTHIGDLSPSRRQAAQSIFPGALVTQSTEEVMTGDIDALVIATPVRTHYQLAREALAQGKHVFVEKPLCESTADAAALVELAERAGRVLMVGHTFLYNPAVEELRRLVQNGELGRIYHVDAVRVNLGLFQPDINVLWDLAPHDLSILNYVLGMQPTSVRAEGEAFVRSGVHDVVHVMLRYPNGLLAHIQVSWLYPSKVRRLTMVGDKRMVVYDDVETTEKIRIFNRGVDAPDHTSTFGEFQLSYRYGDIVIPHIHWTEPLAVECQHFINAIRTGEPPRSDGRDGLQIVRLLEAIQESLSAGGASVLIEAPKQIAIS